MNEVTKMVSETRSASRDIRASLKLDLQPHTIFLLCGPTNSGKSTFARIVSLAAQNVGLSSTILSSDRNRESILTVAGSMGASASSNRYSPSMLAVSKQAFDTLFTDLKVATGFPVGAHIVVVDTTGMDEKFRKSVKEIGERNGYRTVLVTFEYKYRADYESEETSEEAKRIIEESVKKFRRTILPSLRVKDFSDRIRIRSREEVSELDRGLTKDYTNKFLTDVAKQKTDMLFSAMDPGYPSRIVNPDEDPLYAVIGDSHECTEELKSLVTRLETHYPGISIIHIGDYLDKGGDTEAMINYMYERFHKGDAIIQGNHESYVVRKLRGELTKGSAEPEVEKTYFTSLEVLEGREDLQKKLFEIYDGSYPFMILNDTNPSGSLPVFITHAPCENKYLGKVHGFALTGQRNYRVKDRSVPVAQDLEWLYKEAERIHPLHIFGHVAHVVDKRGGERYKNKLFLDTGAVHGNCLTAVLLKEGQIVKFETEKTRERIKDDLPRNLGIVIKKFSIDDYHLTPVDKRLMERIMEAGVKFISGTMSPAPSDNTRLEPLETAVAWLRNAGASQIIAEPKYMGSRCQIYFFEGDKSKTFGVSRKGWVIRGVTGSEENRSETPWKEFLDAEWERRKPLMEEFGDLIVDGELMPWAALGRSLINDSFYGYLSLVGDELSILAQDTEFKELGEFYEKFKLDEKIQHLNSFEEVLERYAGDGPLEFKAFDILSHSKGDPDKLKSESDKFSRLSGDKFLVVSTKEDAVDQMEMLRQFFLSITVDNKMKGLVLKPLFRGECSIPYLKVRSEEYLRLIYGYDYLDPDRYEKLRRQKNVSGKVKLSQSEAKIGYKLLEVTDADEKRELIVRMIGEMNKEQELDPRL